MSLRTTEATNFYYYDKPRAQITDKTFPPGQKITTQLPADVAKIRIAAIFVLTASVSYRIVRVTGWIGWCIPVIVLGLTLAAYVAYQHLWKKDPLVEAFYKIAGGKEYYEKLPEIPLDKNKKTHESFEMSWTSLEHRAYRFRTSDGRKGLLIKGLSFHEKRGLTEAFLQASPTQTQALMIFVEKLGPCDVSRVIANEAEWGASSILAAFLTWSNSFSRLISSSEDRITGEAVTKHIYAWMSTDMANEFIAQKGVVNQLNSQIVEVKDDKPEVSLSTAPQVIDADSDSE